MTQPGNPRVREEMTFAGVAHSDIESDLCENDESETSLVTVRFPDRQIERINGVAKHDEYESKSDVIREAVARMLNEQETVVPREWCL